MPVPILLLDPLVLMLLVGLLVYVWVVWRGSFRRWFGRDDHWTAVAWPLPLVAVGTPLVGGATVAVLGVVGVDIDGGAGGAGLYALAYAVPLVAASVWPPRWLLPSWARRRLTALPTSRGPEVPAGGVAALRADAGHGSRARWAWRVDAIPGWAWVEDEQLRFRSVGAGTPADLGQLPELDDEAAAGLRAGGKGELRLETPRGGTWSRRFLDVDVAGVDRWHVRARRPWRRDGLVVFEVAGRPSALLWVADVRRVADQLADVGPRGGAGAA
jgi:hypothetical protein